MTLCEPSLRKRVEGVFSESGLLSQRVGRYEVRADQQKLALSVLESYEKEEVLLAEAATGVGKSFAYLVPALLYAKEMGEVTVVATHTIALQEQLLTKDIPFLLSVLKLDLNVVLAKGMGNYFCFRRYEEELYGQSGLSLEAREEMESLVWFQQEGKEGSLSEAPFAIRGSTWQRVCAEKVSCTGARCPYFKQCFFFKARRQLSEAHILVVNHHLLMADLSARLRPDFEEDYAILPPYKRVILDEAHHVEEIALESFSVRTSHGEIVQYLGRIHSDLQPYKSRLGLLRSALTEVNKKISSDIIHRLEALIPSIKRGLVDHLDSLFSSIDLFCEERHTERETRWRLLAKKRQTPAWKEEVQGKMEQIQSEVKQLFFSLSLLRKELAQSEDQLASHLAVLDQLEKVLSKKFSDLADFVMEEHSEQRVRWIERSLIRANQTLVEAKLDVSSHLRTLLFEAKKTVVLCSATLTSDLDFTPLKRQLGLSSNPRVRQEVYGSPFDFRANARFLVPKDLPLPEDPTFLSSACLFLKQLLIASQGGCFLLFTSYELLQECFARLCVEKELQGLSLLRQGDLSRQGLLAKFRQRRDSVLFATSSFWEGVDIAGETLRCVVLVKLPFKVPEDPLSQAISEVYAKEGQSGFWDYVLPLACLKFKQGVGRLIRTSSDRGCIVCLDRRIMVRPYGKRFLKTLPPCPVSYQSSQDLLREMREFYELERSGIEPLTSTMPLLRSTN